MSNRARVFRINAVAVCLGSFAGAAFLLAPGRPAFGQGSSEIISGEISTPEDTKSVELVNKTFSFGRNTSALGSMGRFVQPNPPPVGDIKMAFVSGSQSNSIELFSEATSLATYDFGGSQSSTAGSSALASVYLFPGEDEEKKFGPLSVMGATSISVPIDLQSEKKLKFVPELSFDFNFGKVSVTIPFTKKKIEFDLGLKTVNFTLAADVTVNQRARGNFTMVFSPTGVDATPTMEFSTQSTLDRSVPILTLPIPVVSFTVKLNGNATLDVGNSSYNVNAQATYTALKGSAKCEIEKFDLKFGGKVTAEISVKIPLAGDAKLDVELVDLGEAKFSGKKKSKDLFGKK